MCALLAPAQTPAPPPPASPALEQRLIAAFQRDQNALRAYTHREHVVTRKDKDLDGRTLLVWYVHARPVRETIALDHRTLSKDERTAEHGRACERAAAAAKRTPPPAGVVEFGGHTYPFAKLAHDYLYSNPRTVQWQGRTTWAYDAVPNPHAHARSREETLLLHSRGEVYVDAADEHVVRLSIHSTATVRYLLGVLASIQQAGFLLDLQRIRPGVWLPAEADFHLRATVLLFDHIVRSKTTAYFDYSVAANAAARCSG
ncbi:MAG: hypothetical protein ACRD0Y_00580 [Terriglobales bacterium]